MAGVPRWAWVLPVLPIMFTAGWTASLPAAARSSQADDPPAPRSISRAGEVRRLGSRAEASLRFESKRGADVSLPMAYGRSGLPESTDVPLSHVDEVSSSTIGVERSEVQAASGQATDHNRTAESRAPLDPCGDQPPVQDDAVAAEHFFVDRARNVVSLTFDDGPSRAHTTRILEILDRYSIKATFFMLGSHAATMPELVREVAEAGHDIGNHTWSHGSLRSMWKTQIREELCRTNAAIHAASGVRPRLFRPPYGRYPESALALVGGLEMDLVLWSVDSADWGDDDPESIARAVVRAAEPGSIVLLHDREAVTIRALPLIIEGLVRRGFVIEPVSAGIMADAG